MWLQENPSKAKASLFGSKAIRKDYLNLNINQSDSVVDLGVTIDSNLHFTGHINKLMKALFLKLKCLSQFKKMLASLDKAQIIHSIVLSGLNYCDSVYGPWTISQLCEYENTATYTEVSCAFCI